MSGTESGTAGAEGVPSRPSTRRRPWMAGAVVAAALGFLLFRGLGDATMYFKTADEAVAERAQLGTRRFRIEGTVVGGSVRPRDGGVAFRIAGENAEVPVLHRGDPPELFQAGIPVVLEGRFAGSTFTSDRMMVRHSEEYRADNPDRVKDYPEGGDTGGTGR